MVAPVRVYDYARLLDDQFTKSGRHQFDSSLSGGLRLGVCKPVEPARANFARPLVKRGRAIDQGEVGYDDPDRIRQVGGGLQGDLDVGRPGDVEPEGVIAHARLRVGRVPHYGVASVILVAPALCSRSVVDRDVGGPQEGPALRGGSIPDEVKIGAAHASSTVKPGFGTTNWLRTGLQIRGVGR